MIQMLAHRGSGFGGPINGGPINGGLPIVISVAPGQGGAGDAPLTVIITGANFGLTASVAVSGTLVAVSNVVAVSPSIITAVLTIDPAAALTARNLTVTTAGVVLGPFTFTVTASTGRPMVGLELWLDATLPATITIATGVSAWADLRGSGRSVVQAVGGKQPTLVPNTINGLPSVRFDGLSQTLSMVWPNATLANGSTVFIVAVPRFDPSAVKNFPLFRFEPNNANGMQCESTVDANVPSRNRLEAFFATAGIVGRATPVPQVDKGVARVATALVQTVDPATSLYRNGVLEGSRAGNATINSSVGDTFNLGFDSVAEGSEYGQYDIGELAIFSQPEITAVRQSWEAYLVQKWIGAVSAGRGPILHATQVIDGVTVTVDFLVEGGQLGGDMHSSEPVNNVLIFHFSTPIVQFALTEQYSPPTFSGGPSAGMMGGTNLAFQVIPGIPGLGTPTGTPVASAIFDPNGGSRRWLTYLPGFNTVIVYSPFWLASPSYQNARFWLPGDTL